VGTKTRPSKQWLESVVSPEEASRYKQKKGENAEGQEEDKGDQIDMEQRPKVYMKYPHKKHFQRDKFFENFVDNFSKQWDVKCKWNFKNKLKMYGSLQFESLLKAEGVRENRLKYLQKVVDEIMQFNYS